MDFTTATVEKIEQYGEGIADAIIGEVDAVKIVIANDGIEEAREALLDDSVEAWDHFTSYSPFEFIASALNSREDADDAWQALEDGYSEKYSELVDELIDNVGDEMRDVEASKVKDVPKWVEADITLDDVEAIQQGGCASGAYMPAATYATALETMAEHGDDVLDYIGDVSDVSLPDMGDTSWAGVAVHFLSCAVELWALSVELEDYGIE